MKLFFHIRVCWISVLLLLWSLKSSGNLLNVLSARIVPGSIVLPVNMLGLANRLRIISSIYTIAKLRGKSLIVVWQANEDCFASFHDLYISGSVELVEADAAWTNAEFERYVRDAVHSVGNTRALRVSEEYPRDFLVSGDWGSSDVTLVWTRGSHAAATTHCGEYLYSKRQFYNQLQLAPSVLQLVRSVDLSQAGGIVVGVHIRAYDERYDWAVVSPSLPSSNISRDDNGVHDLQSKRFDQAASLQAFVVIMEDLIQLSPNIRFFLASNSAQAKENMIRHFGSDRIITLAAEAHHLRGRESSHSIVVAAAEFHLLGETAFVVHTRGSSFAREAAARSSIPVVDVSLEAAEKTQRVQHVTASLEGSPLEPATAAGGEEEPAMVPLYFYSVRESQPHCAMPEFLRAQHARKPEESSKVCYREDDRVMCTVAYSVCPCDSDSLLYGLRSTKLHCVVTDREALDGEGCVRLLAESNGYNMTTT